MKLLISKNNTIMETKRRFNSTLATKQKAKIKGVSISAKTITRKYGDNIIELSQAVAIRPTVVSPFATLEKRETSRSSGIFAKMIKKF